LVDVKEKGFLKRLDKLGTIIGGAWIVLNILLPLAWSRSQLFRNL